MREGKDDMDTHESMQVKRHLRKYNEGAPKRHPGENRLRHRGTNPRENPISDKKTHRED